MSCVSQTINSLFSPEYVTSITNSANFLDSFLPQCTLINQVSAMANQPNQEK